MFLLHHILKLGSIFLFSLTNCRSRFSWFAKRKHNLINTMVNPWCCMDIVGVAVVYDPRQLLLVFLRFTPVVFNTAVVTFCWVIIISKYFFKLWFSYFSLITLAEIYDRIAVEYPPKKCLVIFFFTINIIIDVFLIKTRKHDDSI